MSPSVTKKVAALGLLLLSGTLKGTNQTVQQATLAVPSAFHQLPGDVLDSIFDFLSKKAVLSAQLISRVWFERFTGYDEKRKERLRNPFLANLFANLSKPTTFPRVDKMTTHIVVMIPPELTFGQLLGLMQPPIHNGQGEGPAPQQVDSLPASGASVMDELDMDELDIDELDIDELDIDELDEVTHS